MGTAELVLTRHGQRGGPEQAWGQGVRWPGAEVGRVEGRALRTEEPGSQERPGRQKEMAGRRNWRSADVQGSHPCRGPPPEPPVAVEARQVEARREAQLRSEGGAQAEHLPGVRGQGSSPGLQEEAIGRVTRTQVRLGEAGGGLVAKDPQE